MLVAAKDFLCWGAKDVVHQRGMHRVRTYHG
jgi:hypothetical protein